MNKILVIQTASIGDVILATALLEKLHRFFPDAAMDIMVKKGMEPLFTGHPFINRLHLWDKSRKYQSFFNLIRDIRKEKYDLVVNVQRFALTGMMTAFSGAGLTVGFDKNPFSPLFSKRIPHAIGQGIHEIHRNQRLIEELTDSEPEKPRLYPQKIPDPGSRIPGIDPDLHLTGIGHPASAIYYTISPASLWFTKQYPAEKWSQLIREMPEEATIFLLGSSGDFELCESIRDMGYEIRDKKETNDSTHIPDPASRIPDPGSRIINLAGQLSLLESSALMLGARMNFTNDSAPMHLASAVNAPVTVVYCSTVPGFGFGPLSDDSTVVEVREKLSCRPCGLHGKNRCPEGHFRCALDIATEDLVSSLRL